MEPVYSNDVRSKCERALVEFLRNGLPMQIPKDHIRAGMETRGNENPKVRCRVDSVEHALTDDGTFKCMARVLVISNGAPNDEEDHRRLEGEIMDLLNIQPQYLAQSLGNAKIGFFSDWAVVRSANCQYIDRQWRTEIFLEIDACGTYRN